MQCAHPWTPRKSFADVRINSSEVPKVSLVYCLYLEFGQSHLSNCVVANYRQTPFQTVSTV